MEIGIFMVLCFILGEIFGMRGNVKHEIAWWIMGVAAGVAGVVKPII